jgi:hypothetical protein
MFDQRIADLIIRGDYQKARVACVLETGGQAFYKVIDPGQLNGEPILDETRTYRMDAIVKVTGKINRQAGRDHVRNWIQIIDQE